MPHANGDMTAAEWHYGAIPDGMTSEALSVEYAHRPILDLPPREHAGAKFWRNQAEAQRAKRLET